MAQTRNLGNIADLLTANTSTGIVSANTAPTQFDNSLKLATTGFVQQALGNFQATTIVNTSTTLTVSQTGSLIILSGSSAFTVTLPTPGSAGGRRFTFYSECTATCTISTPASNIINGGSGTSTLSVPPQTSFDIFCDGASWFVFTGASQASLASAGYQKLPSGFIIQWGSLTGAASSSGNVITFPIAFPNNCLRVVANDVGNGIYTMGCGAYTKTTFTVYTGFYNATTVTYVAASGQYFAIGW